MEANELGDDTLRRRIEPVKRHPVVVGDLIGLVRGDNDARQLDDARADSGHDHDLRIDVHRSRRGDAAPAERDITEQADELVARTRDLGDDTGGLVHADARLHGVGGAVSVFRSSSISAVVAVERCTRAR